MIASHGKLAALLLDEEVVQVSLLGELITETDAIVVDAETDDDGTTMLTGLQARSTIAVGNTLQPHLRQSCSILVIMIADGGCLAPYRAPRLVERGGFLLDDAETIHQVALVQTHRGMFVLGQLQTEMGGLDDGTTLIRHLVNGATYLID